MLTQLRLEVTRVDIEAAGDDHVLLAIEQRQKPIGVEAADISGADETLAIGRVPLGFARLLWLVVISGHHRRRVADDFTGFTDGDLVPVIVDQPDVMTFSRPAHGMQLVGVAVRFEDESAAAFGHAIKLDQSSRPAREHIGL